MLFVFVAVSSRPPSLGPLLLKAGDTVSECLPPRHLRWKEEGESPKPRPAMSIPADDLTALRIELGDEAFALLLEMAEACHTEPRKVAAALLTDVLLDDARADGAQVHAGIERALLN